MHLCNYATLWFIILDYMLRYVGTYNLYLQYTYIPIYGFVGVFEIRIRRFKVALNASMRILTINYDKN